MSKFKIGDKVRVTSNVGTTGFFSMGAEGVVVAEGIPYGAVQVHFVAGPYNCDGPWWVSSWCLEKIKPYRETFTEKAKEEPAKGHVADSPIQKHSVGEFYPLAVVGYGQGSIVTYVVENLAQQTVAGWGSESVRQWASSEDAASFAARVKSDDPNRCWPKWFCARPVFAGPNSNHLVLPPAPAKRTRVVFEKQDDIIEINGAYYKALEQDIG